MVTMVSPARSGLGFGGGVVNRGSNSGFALEVFVRALSTIFDKAFEQDSFRVHINTDQPSYRDRSKISHFRWVFLF